METDDTDDAGDGSLDDSGEDTGPDGPLPLAALSGGEIVITEIMYNPGQANEVCALHEPGLGMPPKRRLVAPRRSVSNSRLEGHRNHPNRESEPRCRQPCKRPKPSTRR
ncbi:MAG: hypothetical protein AAFV53_33630 [Myxococcota bacterium]